MNISPDTGMLVTVGIIFITGFLSGLSPCTLPSVVFVTAFVTGSRAKTKKDGFIFSMAFVLGISFVLTLLGLFAGGIGGFLINTRLLNIIIAVIMLVMGLWLLKVFNIKTAGLPGINLKSLKNTGLIGVFLLGIPFGVIASPCTLPVTLAVLAYTASTGSLLLGALLMFIFAVGRSVPLILAGTFTGMLKNIEKLSVYQEKAETVTGYLLILLALYFIWIA